MIIDSVFSGETTGPINDEILITENCDFVIPYTGTYVIDIINGGDAPYTTFDGKDENRSTIWPGKGKEFKRFYRQYVQGQIIPVTIGKGGIASKNGTTNGIYGGTTTFDDMSGSDYPYWTGVLEIFGGEIRANGGGLGAGNYTASNASWYGAGAGGAWNSYDGVVGPRLGNGYQGAVRLRFHNPTK